MNDKIKYSNLSLPLKFAVILAWVVGGLYLIFFSIGFIEGVVSASTGGI